MGRGQLQFPKKFRSESDETIEAVSDFEMHMCRERKLRLNWKQILLPCIGHMQFGKKMISETIATDPELSLIVGTKIRPTGEYSMFKIKTYTSSGVPKNIGGDTWRVFLRGPSFIEPFVWDQTNGEYEVSFLLLEAGRYEVEIYMEGTLCSGYVDPPDDWFKKGKKY